MVRSNTAKMGFSWPEHWDEGLGIEVGRMVKFYDAI